jgi:hypothetical protein
MIANQLDLRAAFFMWLRFVRDDGRLRFINSTASLEIMVCIALSISGGTDDCIICRDPASTYSLGKSFSYDHTVSDPRENRDASISIVVPIIISIVMVPMMVPVPALPPVFVGVTVVAVAVVAVVVRSVWLVSGANVNAKPIVCFRPGGYQGNQPERRQT